MFKRDLELDRTWAVLLSDIEKMIGKRPKDLNSVVFLIGVQELGQGKRVFQQRRKTGSYAHWHLQTVELLRLLRARRPDKDGWPHWKLVEITHFDLLEQEKLLKMHALEYFEKEFEWVRPDFSAPPAAPGTVINP